MTKSPSLSLNSSVVSHVKSTGPSSDSVGLLANSFQNLFSNRIRYLTFEPIFGGFDSFAASSGKRSTLIVYHTEGGTARITSSASTDRSLPLMVNETLVPDGEIDSTGEFFQTVPAFWFS